MQNSQGKTNQINIKLIYNAGILHMVDSIQEIMESKVFNSKRLDFIL